MNYNAVIIELLTSILGVVLLVLGLILPKDKKTTVGYVSAIGLTLILIFSFLRGNGEVSFLNGLYSSDKLSIYFKQLFLIGGILVTLMSFSYVKRFSDSKNEFFALNVFAILGMMVMASSNDFITLYIGLELMTISFIILTAFDKRNAKSTEAGIKYILLSAISSAVLLYGMSLMYGVSGSIAYVEIFNYLKISLSQPIVVLSAIMIISGFAFKISAVPFHMWSPDIYEGAPTPITAFLAIGSKAAAFAMLIRFFVVVLPSIFNTISPLIISLAVLSMIIGNVIAIPQTNIKRMLAFSSIAQAGYILLGLIAYTSAGISAMLYYLLLYSFANAGAFGAIIAFSIATGKDDIKDFGGAFKRSPFLGAVLMISLLSMAGIPPAAGFIGKFYLFAEIIKQGYLWLAFLAMGMSVVSIYYYIVVIRTILIGETDDSTQIKVPLELKLVMTISFIMTLILGLYPGPVSQCITGIANTVLK